MQIVGVVFLKISNSIATKGYYASVVSPSKSSTSRPSLPLALTEWLSKDPFGAIECEICVEVFKVSDCIVPQEERFVVGGSTDIPSFSGVSGKSDEVAI